MTRKSLGGTGEWRARISGRVASGKEDNDMAWPNAQGFGDGGREGRISFPHKCEEVVAVAGTVEQPYAFKF